MITASMEEDIVLMSDFAKRGWEGLNMQILLAACVEMFDERVKMLYGLLKGDNFLGGYSGGV